MAEFNVSGNDVTDYKGRIVATCPTVEDAEHTAKVLNEDDARNNFRPFGRLDPDDPIDQAIVKAFNRGASRAE